MFGRVNAEIAQMVLARQNVQAAFGLRKKQPARSECGINKAA
ncbi:hypothetical protein [Kingella denitrificans]|nr:hypothetical protein [Kingella denitrificans]